MGLLTSKIKCGDDSFTHHYLSPYLPLTAGKDAISLSLVKFKQRIQPDLDAWIACSADLLGNLSFSPDTIIIRALRHNEISARPEFPCALDLLGHTLAARLHCRYLPELLSKTRPTLPGKHLTRQQRRAQLENVYQVAAIPLIGVATPEPGTAPPPSTSPIQPTPAPQSTTTTPDPTPTPLPPTTPVLLIDDILTTGATMRALILTLRNHYPGCPIMAFTLTRADYQSPSLPLPLEGEIFPLETLKSLILANTV
ncbi:MAG TPA: phosphoribosyltransferase family protein [Puia sp.]|nr:phosphoribosyltransferase family protein [Puia sp.]